MGKAHTGRRIDMLHGSMADKILLFALPLAASSILQQLFNSADVAVVGRFADSTAQAAVGCNSALINLMLNLFIGLSTGTNVVIANYIGQGKRKEVHSTVHTVFAVALISGVFLLTLGQVIASPVLHLLNTPEETVGQAVAYLRIYFLGMPFIMVYNFGAAILRSVGDTRRPLLCLSLAGVLNVLLNLLMVIVFRLGAAGVAIATAVSNGLSASLVLFFLLREDSLIRLDLRKLRIRKAQLLRMMQIGIPAGLQGMVFSFSNVCMQSKVNDFGSAAVAGTTVCSQVDTYVFLIISAFTQATVTFTSQNFGAHQLDRCKRIYRLSLFMALCVTGVLCMTIYLFRMPLIHIFSKDAEAIPYAMIRIFYVGLFSFMTGIYEIAGAALRGIGRSLTPAVITIVGTGVFRLVWIYLLFGIVPAIQSYSGLCVIYPITWVATGAAMLPTYFLIRKKVFARAEKAFAEQSAVSAAL